MNVSEAVLTRISCRSFLPDPVSPDIIKKLLDTSRMAPSGGNLQPWNVHAVGGKKLQAIFSDVREKMKVHPRGEGQLHRSYPKDLIEPYWSRRDKCGEDLYATISIGREDKPGRIRQFRRNFEMFGAPVGLFIYIDKTMEEMQWADAGIFIQTILLMARELGLHSCPQGAWAAWHETLAGHLNPPEHHHVVCGIAIGYMDEAAPVNYLRTERAALDDIVEFHGF